MKKILALISLGLGFVAAQATTPSGHPVKEHRGFFFSSGLGLTYHSIEKDDYYDDYWDSETEEYEYDFSGFSIPALEFKLGVSMGNLFAVYFDLSADATSMGTSKDITTYKYSGIPTAKTTIKETNTQGYSFLPGLGLACYPVRNTNSVMNGFYFAFAEGVELFLNETEKVTDIDAASIFSKVEIGKDWWVLDTWSIGASVSYYLYSQIDEDVSSVHRLQFMLHFTRG